MSFSSVIETLKTRIGQIKKAMADAVTNHTTLTGHLAEAENSLDLVTKAAEAIAPNSPVTSAISVVDEVVDTITVDAGSAPATAGPAEAVQQSGC